MIGKVSDYLIGFTRWPGCPWLTETCVRGSPRPRSDRVVIGDAFGMGCPACPARLGWTPRPVSPKLLPPGWAGITVWVKCWDGRTPVRESWNGATVEELV